MRIIATPLTSGPVTPGLEERGGKTTWRWRGKPPGWPFDPATHDDTRPARTADAERRAAAKDQRKQAFAAALATGLSVPQASREVGIDQKTGYNYKKELDLEAGS